MEFVAWSLHATPRVRLVDLLANSPSSYILQVICTTVDSHKHCISSFSGSMVPARATFIMVDDREWNEVN